MIRVTVWNEYSEHQKTLSAVYSAPLHEYIAGFLNREEGIRAETSVQSAPEYGLGAELLERTDVLVYWAHAEHHLIPDEVSHRVKDAVNRGMGVLFLHSAHKSKAFMELMGTTGNLLWREIGERERIVTAKPAHPIAAGVPESFALEHEEMYGEPFDIPEPDATVFIGWFEGGNVFRSGVEYARGRGKVFYFQPGHETYPVYKDPSVQKIMVNAVRYLAPRERLTEFVCRQQKVPPETGAGQT